MKAQILQWLQKYTADDRRSMSLFTGGGFLFAAGTMIILLVNALMEPSLNQELFALVGLIMLSIGSVVALWGYLGISLFKLFIYLLEDKHD